MNDDKFFLLQKQLKDNSEDLQSMSLDMKNWEAEMKRKEQDLCNRQTNQNLPPIRSKTKNITQEPIKQDKNSNSVKARTISCDYSSWDKFDAEKACKELDNVNLPEKSKEELFTAEALEENHKKATKQKEKGNEFVKQQKWDSAIACYSEAIIIFPLDPVFYANRALCYLKKDNPLVAEADCTLALALDPKYIKAYYRRATIKMELKKYQEAKQDLQSILQLEPSNKEAKEMLTLVNNKIGTTKIIVINNKINNKKAKKQRKNKKKEKIEQELQQEIEQEIEKEKTTSEVKYIPIPDWLPEKDNVEIVHPITKPPHLYSKELMKPIKVQNAKFEATKCKEEDSKISNSNNIKLSKPSNAVNNKTIKEKHTVFQPSNVEELPIVIPKVPRTAVQFLMDWRRNKSSKYRYQYLKQIPLNSLPSIFQNSMEVNLLCEILHTLETEFLPQKDQVYQYLKDLSKIKRFRALVMFISNAEKSGIQTLLEYCQNIENKTEEEIKELYKAYELNYRADWSS